MKIDDIKKMDSSQSDENNNKTQFRLPWVFPFQRPNFYLPRLKIGIPLHSPPSWLITLLVMLVLFYIFSGGVYNQLKSPIAYFRSDEGVNLIYQRVTGRGACAGNTPHQYAYEGLVAGMLILLGTIGLYSLYFASRDPHKPERAFNYQVIGVICVIIAVFIVENMMDIKGCVP